MRRPVVRWASRALIAAGVGGTVLACVAGIGRVSDGEALKSTDMTGLRAEALGLFPRGSRLDAATARLARMGFSCEPVAHPLPDISGPSLRCASNGRGYPDFPAVTVILLTRNGMVSDVDVWNIMARADGGDDIDFTAVGATDALPTQLRRPEPPEATDTTGSVAHPNS